MDPNATLMAIEQCLRHGDDDELLEQLCEALAGWIDRGGFHPDWEAHQAGYEYFTSYYRRPAAR
jgi:hypothetical protein